MPGLGNQRGASGSALSATSKYFAAAFDNAFKNKTSTAIFAQDKVSSQYNTISNSENTSLPKSRIALSPHADASVSLAPATTRIRTAKSSVFYAVMQPTGGGDVLSSLRTIAAKPTVFSYGTVETPPGWPCSVVMGKWAT